MPSQKLHRYVSLVGPRPQEGPPDESVSSAENDEFAPVPPISSQSNSLVLPRDIELLSDDDPEGRSLR